MFTTLVLIAFSFLPFIQVSKSSLILCSEKVSRVQVCQNKASYRPNIPPTPRICVISPVVDVKDILDVDTEKKTITIHLYIILQWMDDGLNYAIPDGKE